MKAALSRPSDCGEVQSKDSTEMDSSWTEEKHMSYLSSLEDSFVSQLHGSDFHLHLMNLLGRTRTKLREPESSITSGSLCDSSQYETSQQGCRENLKFVKAKLGVQKKIASFSSSENQWIKHFAPSVRGKGVANCQAVAHQSSYSRKSVKKESCSYSKEESTSQSQPSFSSHNDHGYGEVSGQNFVNEDINGAELSLSCKKIRLSSPVAPLNQVVLEISSTML